MVRRCVAAVVAVVALAVAASALAAGTVAGSAAAKKPHASVSFGQGVQIVGASFKPHERLAVTLVGGDHTWARKVTAKASGAFTIDLGLIGLNECNAYTLKIVGSLKSRVSVTHPTEPC